MRRRRRYSLVVLNADRPVIGLNELPATVGRGQKADIRFKNVYVSRKHCEIYETGDGLIVHDLGSKNGTFVNGMRIEFSLLRCDDVLGIGTLSLALRGRK